MSEFYVPSVRYKHQVERSAMKELQLVWMARQLFQNPKLLLTDEVREVMPVYLSDEDIIHGLLNRTSDGRVIMGVVTCYDIQKDGLKIVATISGNELQDSRKQLPQTS